MSIEKITNAPTPNEHIAKTNEIIEVVNNGGSTSTDVQVNSTSITNNNIANIITNSAYNPTSNKIATMSDIPDISGLANNSSVVHNTGDETISGIKEFNNQIYVKNSTTQGYEPVLTYPNATNTYATKRLGNVPSDVTSIPPTTLYNFDGQWVASVVKIVDSTSNTSGTNIYLNSSGTSGAGKNYLPNDNYNYEVIFQIRMGCNTSQGTQVTLNCGTDIIDTNLSGEIFTVSKNATAMTVVFTMPVGTSRYFKYSLSNSTSNTTACRVTAIGYRRIGTNS